MLGIIYKCGKKHNIGVIESLITYFWRCISSIGIEDSSWWL